MPSDMRSAAAVEIRGVSLRRQGRTIIRDVDLTVMPGEKWILFGPNGIGKSTIVRMMATRLHPTEGTVSILGNALGKVDVFSYRHRIGLSSAELSRSFPPDEDPLDVVLTALTATTGRWRETFTPDDVAKARTLLSRFAVSYVEGKRLFRLSEGERTRVLVCRALMADPDLLILDEPTTGLDLGGREIALQALSRIGMDGGSRAVVLVTHRLEEIPRGFDHIAIMGRDDMDGNGNGNGAITDDDAGDDVRESSLEADPAPGTIVYAGSLNEGLTSQRLSRVFGLPLTVVSTNGRWAAYASE
ncbi:MAG: ATP-binding cassette domain-containing protein [Bifidobacterium minimum]|nr:ATP-binding cassette domain-containing protein [Bifidobacterium minimum]